MSTSELPARRLHGAIAASVTPMSGGGDRVEHSAVEGLVAFLHEGDADGALVGGTTGEGVLLDVGERRSLAESFVACAPPAFPIAVHAGAQSTRDTVSLAAHARESGAAAVAVIAPPYFPLDGDAIERHLVSAANAADPLAFYVYEFAARSGYAIPPGVVRRIRSRAPNVVGMKVSDTPFSAVEPYLALGLDVFVGNEPLVLEAAAAGASGCVSGLAAAFPRLIAALVHDLSAEAHDLVLALREGLATLPFHAALKASLVAEGVLPHQDVRAPLRSLTEPERVTALTLARRASSFGGAAA